MIAEITRGMGLARQEETRSDPFLSIEDYIGMVTQFGYSGTQYTLVGSSQEAIAPAFQSLAQLAYRSSGVVFACMAVRMLLFSEARFQFRQQVKGRPGNLFGNADLAPLESPWPGGTTGDLLSKALQHADLAGNAFITRRPGRTTPAAS